ncbi:MAG: hypothetical protein CMJ75_22730 [Planctomycetaceae bacterium]|nr:hypothetical protein [Planctomycetaceae bacterium]
MKAVQEVHREIKVSYRYWQRDYSTRLACRSGGANGIGIKFLLVFKELLASAAFGREALSSTMTIALRVKILLPSSVQKGVHLK